MQNIIIDCEVFFDGTLLIRNMLQGSYYELIYLDVEMNTVNGIQIAETIRSMNIPALIVYISGYEKYLKELFNTEPFRFLSKPIETKVFCDVFIAACRRIQQKMVYFSYTYNKAYSKVPLNKISYFESRNRVVHIHMPGDSNAKDRFYGKINDVERQLSSGSIRFVRIHQSFLVNINHIINISYTKVTMSDGTILQISEERQKKVRAQFCWMLMTEVQDDGCL